jgi:omega-6 fatty acid desaturase (delta-12 desaturase)
MADVALRSLRELTQITAAFTVEDRRRSWEAVLSTAGLLTTALAVAAIQSVPLAVRLCSSAAAIPLLVRMFVIYHDFEHGAILKHSRAAQLLLSAYGLFILSPPSIWNRLHNYHHSHNSQFATSGIGSFPVMTVGEYRAASWWVRARYRAVRSGAMIALAYLTVFVSAFCMKSVHDEPHRHRDSALALALHLALIAVYAQLGWLTLVLGLVGPIWCAHAIGAYLFYAQHNVPGIRLRPREQWDYVFAAVYSSSFMDGGRLMKWWTGNIGYHNVHHLNSKIPFYRLPDAMAAVAELKQSPVTTLRLRDVRGCLSLKLWDPEKPGWVGF